MTYISKDAPAGWEPKPKEPVEGRTFDGRTVCGTFLYYDNQDSYAVVLLGTQPCYVTNLRPEVKPS